MQSVPAADVVVFDIFDTLIVRPFLGPKDLFKLVECSGNAPGFAEARVAAERSSRETIRREITLEEIYTVIPEQYRHLMDLELEIEKSCCRADKEALDLFNKLKSEGRRIVLASDMYLTPGVISEILESCGYSGWEKMYISGTIHLSKNSGKMYAHIAEDLGIPSEKIIVIGDSDHSDVEMGNANGMQTLRWRSLKERYAESHPNEMKFAKKHPEASPLVGTDMLIWQESRPGDYWFDVGMRFGGPMAANFAVMIHDNLPADAEKILFFARDGFGPYKAYIHIFPEDDRCVYLHTSRLISKAFRENHPAHDRDEAMSILTYIEETGRAESLGITKDMSFSEKTTVLKTKEKEVTDILAEGRKNYITYLRKQTDFKTKLVFVDTTTKNFTSQRIICECLPDVDAMGIYYAVTGKWDLKQAMYCDRRNQHLSSTYVNIAETIFAAAAAPVRDFSPEGEPLFTRPMNEGEKKREAYAKSIFMGCAEYGKLYLSLWGKNMPYVNGETMDAWVDVLVANEKKNRNDETKLGGMKWYVDTRHKRSMHAIIRPADVVKSVLWKGVSLAYKLGIRK